MLNNIKESDFNLDYDTITNALNTTTRKIAPLWPLESFVAVNPYLGLSGQSFESTAKSLSGLAGIQTTMSPDFYLDAIKENKILLEDLKTVLHERRIRKNVQSFIKEVRDKDFKNIHNPKVKTVAEVAQKVTAANWPDFMVDSISSWASSYFDSTQSQWNENGHKLSIFSSWKIEAETNRSPSLMGLKGFHKLMRTLPNNHIEAVKVALNGLGIEEGALAVYLHSLLLRVGGWSSYVAHYDWDDKRYSREGTKLVEFLSMLICWEYGIYNSLKNLILESEWKKAKTVMKEFEDSESSNQATLDLIILQEAYDLTAQRRLISKFERKASSVSEEKKPRVQAVFCIDVRSEVYRRNLETVAPEIETLGFAGFFGFPINFRKLGHDEGFDQCPALIPSGYTVIEKVEDKNQNDKVVLRRKLNRAFKFAWKSFKSNAISSFGFVSPLGLSLLPKLFTDSFGWTRPVPHPHKNGLSQLDIENLSVNLDSQQMEDITIGIPLADRVNMAKGALQAMSLTDNFAKVVMIVGHGSSSVNNPHASGLDCGACAGQSGEANAKVAALILNDKEVRRQLAEEKIYIPDTTYFIACLHDTTLDEISLFNTNRVPASHQEDLENIKQRIQEAGKATRAERVLRMSMDGDNIDSFIKSRSKDWSQVRPEWGLAGCSSFVVAPRHITRGLDLEGRAFLHSYNWKEDKEFKVLESIMTAPMVVTSWINLQYYASTVDNKHFGSGNKTLHNVTSGIGVLEGYAGDLRSGLPMQSIHDGVNYQHEPLRLNVVINAPIEGMTKVLEENESVRQLCNNQWIFLMAMNDEGEITDVYDGDLMWRKLQIEREVIKENEKLVEELV